MTSSLPPQDPSPEHLPPAGPTSDGPTSAGPGSTEPSTRPKAGLDQKGRVKRTRASELWIGLITAAVLAILFLVFIAQNSDKVAIHFLGWDGRISLAISLLLSAVIGALVVAVPGIVRIVQLRTALRRNAKG
jgi:putative membrane protein